MSAAPEFDVLRLSDTVSTGEEVVVAKNRVVNVGTSDGMVAIEFVRMEKLRDGRVVPTEVLCSGANPVEVGECVTLDNTEQCEPHWRPDCEYSGELVDDGFTAGETRWYGIRTYAVSEGAPPWPEKPVQRNDVAVWKTETEAKATKLGVPWIAAAGAAFAGTMLLYHFKQK